jgi:tripartite-type tricarboxylate transporter receptor subunit TctC
MSSKRKACRLRRPIIGTSRFFAALLAVSVLSCTEGEAPVPRLESISIVIPYRAGGGFDRSVRLFAPFFERALGEQVQILPDNSPGAGGRLGAVKVYRARPDGSTLGIFNLPGFVLPEVLGETVEYDLRQLSWIGRLESEDYVLLVANDSPIEDLDGLRAAQRLTFLSTGYGSTVLAASQILADQLQLDSEDTVFLTGYTGTADSLVGLMRGDGNVALAPISSALPYLESGDLRPLAVSGHPSRLPGVPSLAELGYPELTPLNVQRALAGPPDMDPELLETLRAAFLAAVSNREFLQRAESAGMIVAPTSGEAVVTEVEASFGYYERFRSDLTNPNTSAAR